MFWCFLSYVYNINEMSSSDKKSLFFRCLRSSSPVRSSPKEYQQQKSKGNNCCYCCYSTKTKTKTELSSSVTTSSDTTVENSTKGFFKRIQCFKAHKRKIPCRKNFYQNNVTSEQQQETTTKIETIQRQPEKDELSDNIDVISPTQIIRSSQSIPLLSTKDLNHQHETTTAPSTSFYNSASPFYSYKRENSLILNRNKRNESCSLVDIEVASTTNDTPTDRSYTPNNYLININKDSNRQKSGCFTPHSFASGEFSSTDLSAYSTQSLLRRLIDKANLLNEFYADCCAKTTDHIIKTEDEKEEEIINKTPPLTTDSYLSSKHSSSVKRLIDDDSRTTVPKYKHRSIYDNLSEDSRFNLYSDEDNVLRELIRFNNDIDLILSRLEMEGEQLQHTTSTKPRSHSPTNQLLLDDNNFDSKEHLNNNNSTMKSSITLGQRQESQESELLLLDDQQFYERKTSSTSQGELLTSPSYEVMRTTSTTSTNEINVHLLLSNDINRLREKALTKLLKLVNLNCTNDVINNQDIVTLASLSKLPKSSLWKTKQIFGVPLRIYQQSSGRLLPLAITDALQYLRLHAGKCDGLFRKPGVKSKIDRLRNEIETHDSDHIKFDDYQPYAVADVVRQYFRLPQEDQLLAIRYSFLLLPDETRDVLETILRFLFDVSIRSGASQTTCRSLARIFVPSVFQSYHELRSTKLTWWKWRKEIKLDSIAQESERLTLELCLMAMILNVDVLCRVPSALSEELQLPSQRTTKRLDSLIRSECNGEFLIKEYIAKESERFIQQLQNTKYKSVQLPTNDLDINELGIHKQKLVRTELAPLPTWKCSVDIPANIKQVSHRILNERYMWDSNFAESRIVEKLDDDTEILQYVLNFLDLVPVRSFCEFRYTFLQES
ncbi:unnamed protein product [Didymodactylos carnosus]|uniref:Rho-GAP domain-containing protein n=1 Tax=Didymodactylos carnosus TaxID=1234261 RepID=A0A8S2GQT3_9BILA|nr:unnamed protein product [Didymodactylos carnosus]CAF3546292.1 unnamed protein product [Didymodactylos carnosus]